MTNSMSQSDSESESENYGIVKRETSKLAGNAEAAVVGGGASLTSPERQNSILSLTLQEFQVKSGINFGSMSIDEFINSVLDMDVQENPNQNHNNNGGGGGGQNGLILPPRQGSFTIPPPLCNKTVQEVWAELQGNDFMADGGVLGTGMSNIDGITLEGFLVKVGVGFLLRASDQVQENVVMNVGEPLGNGSINFSPNNSSSFDTNNVIDHDQPMMDMDYSQPDDDNEGGVQVGGVLTNAPLMYPMFAGSENFVGESSKTPMNGTRTGNGNGTGTRRTGPVPKIGESNTRRRSNINATSMDYVVERRQRRMIKNRESAARSRARKQAYTAELELELGLLREDNSRLRLILHEEAEIRDRVEAERRERDRVEAERREREEAIRRMERAEMMNEKVTAEKKWKALRRTKSF